MPLASLERQVGHQEDMSPIITTNDAWMKPLHPTVPFVFEWPLYHCLPRRGNSVLCRSAMEIPIGLRTPPTSASCIMPDPLHPCRCHNRQGDRGAQAQSSGQTLLAREGAGRCWEHRLWRASPRRSQLCGPAWHLPLALRFRIRSWRGFKGHFDRAGDGGDGPDGSELGDLRSRLPRPAVRHGSNGILWAVDLTTGARTVFLDVSAASCHGERGLLGVAFHPAYQSNGLVTPTRPSRRS